METMEVHRRVSRCGLRTSDVGDPRGPQTWVELERGTPLFVVRCERDALAAPMRLRFYKLVGRVGRRLVVDDVWRQRVQASDRDDVDLWHGAGAVFEADSSRQAHQKAKRRG